MNSPEPAPIPTSKVLFTVREAAHALGISVSYLRLHLVAGNLRSTRLGTRVMFTPSELARIARRGLPSLKRAA